MDSSSSDNPSQDQHSSVNWTQVRAVFDDIADATPDVQREALDVLPEADREALRRLLDAHEDDQFLVEREIDDTASPHAGLPDEPRRIGPYTIRERIGEGGFGVVYRAHQSVPVDREVALKLIKPESESPQGIARFIDERDYLASIDHPNIVKVLDAGTTPDGRLFVVMELVRGQPITDHARDVGLALNDRVRLMIDAARAVHHVHQRAIIHRDLKPNNMLVSSDEGEARLRIIDFGIATALQEEDRAGWTRAGGPIGTPRYASPEQFRRNVPVDIRADVFALGMVLCELLTGQLPRDPGTESNTTIRRPSSLAPTTNPSFNPRLLRGDLDRIIMKCVAEEPDRRYDSAAALADDLERYLRGEAVLAAPPGTIYLMRKFMLRHQVAVAFAGIALLALVGGLALALDGRARAMEQKLEAEIARGEADRQARRAEDVAAFLLRDMIAATDPVANRALDRQTTIIDVLRATESSAPAWHQGDPRSLFDILGYAGVAYVELHEWPSAIPPLERAIALAGEFEEKPWARLIELRLALNTARDRSNRRVTLDEERRTIHADALRELGPAHPMTLSAKLATSRDMPVDGQRVAALRELASVTESLPPLHHEVLKALGTTLHQLEQFDEEILVRRMLVELAIELFPDWQTDRMSSLYELARAYDGANQPAPALMQLEQIIDAPSDRVPEVHPGRVSATLLASRLASELGQHERAMEIARIVEENADLNSVLGPYHRLSAQTAYGSAAFAAGMWQVAVDTLEAADEDRRQLFGEGDIYRYVAFSMIAESYRQLGDADAAADICGRLYEHFPPHLEAFTDLALTWSTIHRARGDQSASDALIDDAMTRAQAANAPDQAIARLRAHRDSDD